MEKTFIRPLKKPAQDNPLNDLPALFEAALTEFANNSYGIASLNDIIKASGLSKGSFYHRFADKMDLYLCVMDVISQKKAAYAQDMPPTSGDFFEQLRFLFRHSLQFALSEPKFDAFWRRYLTEGADVKDAVNSAFPSRGSDWLDALVKGGHFRFPAPFVLGIINLLFSHLDTLIEPGMSHDDILILAGNLIDMLKSGLEETPA
jgi:AcrR family transcriptional regulator